MFALIVYLKSFLEFLNGKKYHQEIIIVLFLPLQPACQLSFLLSLPLCLGHLAQRWIVVIVGFLIMFRSSQGMLWPLAIWGDCCGLSVESVYQVKGVHFYFICYKFFKIMNYFWIKNHPPPLKCSFLSSFILLEVIELH